MSDCVDFGIELLETNDLDPVYVMLYESDISDDKFYKWLLAYWCFYDSGTASWIVDQKRFWKAMRECANDPKAKRGTERRHFRAENANRSLDYLERCGIDNLLDPLLETTTFDQVKRIVSGWIGFGPWMTFKIADMLECLDLAKIEFTTQDVFFYQSPLEGARRLALNLKEEIPEKEVASWATNYLIEELSDYYAPPAYNRDIGIQEVETVLCKWKSHLNGKYKVGEDLEYLEKSLSRMDTITSKQLLKTAKKCKLI
jgi:hypothetical protein